MLLVLISAFKDWRFSCLTYLVNIVVAVEDWPLQVKFMAAFEFELLSRHDLIDEIDQPNTLDEQ